MKVRALLFVPFLLLALPTNVSAHGAIAVDDDTDTLPLEAGYGFSVNEASREEAAAEALAQCRKSGNRECRVVVRFDKCGAYAASRRYYGVGWGNTLATAESKALSACGAGCRVVISECE